MFKNPHQITVQVQDIFGFLSSIKKKYKKGHYMPGKTVFSERTKQTIELLKDGNPNNTELFF